MIRAFVPVLFIGFALVAPSAGAQRPALHNVGRGVQPVVSDGERFAAYGLQSGSTRIIDTAGRRSRSWQVDPRPHCDAMHGRTGPDVIGGGRLAWECMRPDSRLAVLPYDIRRGRFLPMVNVIPAADSADGGRVLGIGRHWLHSLVAGYHYSGFKFSRLTEAADERAADAPAGATYAPDLNHPRLHRLMCRGMKRPASGDSSPGQSDPPYSNFMYEPPFGIAVQPALGFPAPLLLQRCGKRSIRVCSASCSEAQLGARIVSWAGGGGGNVYLPASGRTIHYVPTSSPFGLPHAAHTATRIFVSAELRSGGVDVYSARLPARR